MEIIYEIIENTLPEGIVYGWGCYMKCEVNTDYGADYWCCERIKGA